LSNHARLRALSRDRSRVASDVAAPPTRGPPSAEAAALAGARRRDRDGVDNGPHAPTQPARALVRAKARAHARAHRDRPPGPRPGLPRTGDGRARPKANPPDPDGGSPEHGARARSGPLRPLDPPGARGRG